MAMAREAGRLKEVVSHLEEAAKSLEDVTAAWQERASRGSPASDEEMAAIRDLGERLHEAATTANHLRRRALPSLWVLLLAAMLVVAAAGSVSWLSSGGGGGPERDPAVLRLADLRGANLSGADLAHADLTAACFRDALLLTASLDGAVLSDADLRGAQAGSTTGLDSSVGIFIIDEATTLPLDFDTTGRTRLARPGETTSCL